MDVHFPINKILKIQHPQNIIKILTLLQKMITNLAK